MGMFDYVKIDPVLLPEKLPEELQGFWQTKDTPDQYLTTYEITSDAGIFPLVWNGLEYERGEPLADFHADVRFYDSNEKTGEWFEFVARFTDGKLSRIWRLPSAQQ